MRLTTGVYNANLKLERAISIHGAGATLVATEAPGLYVVDAAVAKVYDLAIVKQLGGASPQDKLGVLCETSGADVPKLFLERVVVESQTGTRPMHLNLCTLKASRTTLKMPRIAAEEYMLLVANGGTAEFDRSQFIGGGGIATFSAQITITNSILDGVLGKATEGALLAAFGSINVSFSTIFNSPLPCSTGDIPGCASAARSGVCIENSIVNKPSSPSDTITGDRCRCDYCLVSPQQGPVLGASNLVGDAPSFKDPVNNDFHLNADSPARDAAHPSIPGTADYDGVMRPQNGRSDMGAFEFKP